MATGASITINGIGGMSPNIPNSSSISQKYIPPMKRHIMLQNKKNSVSEFSNDYNTVPGSNFRFSKPSKNTHNKGNYIRPFKDSKQVNDFSYKSNYSPTKNKFKNSLTGTRWDVRDNRNWNTECSEEIFNKECDISTTINFDSYDFIPVEVSGDKYEQIQPIVSFSKTENLHPLLTENIKRVRYEKPTPVQKYSIPVILASRDLMACAQTGSGKTAAFLFPIINKLLQDGPPPTQSALHRSYYKVAYPVVLVLSPTRELAIQIYQESKKFSFNTGLMTIVLYGGSELKTQFYALDNGCDICVATPGRLSDVLKRGKVQLKSLKYLVLDEADRMLDMGFAPQIDSIINEHDMPTSAKGRQTIMFSATFPDAIQKLAADFLNNYIFLTVGKVGSTNKSITQSLIYANEYDKPKFLLDVLYKTGSGLILVFVETKRKADIIGNFLCQSGFDAVSIHGDKNQCDREHALNLFRSGKCPVLVATDIASRGLDIQNIKHVINCDFPARIDDYVHRIGRTGRAGNQGQATSFVNEQNRSVLIDLLSLLKEANQNIPMWFYEMVHTCTGHNKGFDSFVENSAWGKIVSRPNINRGNGKDIRIGQFSNNSSIRNTPYLSKTNRDSLNDFNLKKNDDEDGW